MTILAKGIIKKFNNLEVIKGIDFQMSEGEQCALVGSSGSGKSTLLYLLGGLDKPTSGDIWINKEKIDHKSDEEMADFRNKNVGFIFQFHFLLSSMNCLQNILLPVRLANFALQPFEARAVELASHLGVKNCLTKYPYQISGGEQQRINLIRALMMKPKILLCDEPTGNLDSKNSQKVIVLLKELAEHFKATLLIVTHDDKIAQGFTRKITIEDGRIIG